jgi:hypothetical protein
MPNGKEKETKTKLHALSKIVTLPFLKICFLKTLVKLRVK